MADADKARKKKRPGEIDGELREINLVRGSYPFPTSFPIGNQKVFFEACETSFCAVNQFIGVNC